MPVVWLMNPTEPDDLAVRIRRPAGWEVNGFTCMFNMLWKISFDRFPCAQVDFFNVSAHKLQLC